MDMREAWETPVLQMLVTADEATSGYPGFAEGFGKAKSSGA